MKLKDLFEEQTKSQEGIIALIDKHNMTNGGSYEYTITPEGIVNFPVMVMAAKRKLKGEFPFQFGEVGSFDASLNELTSLKGAPHTVRGFFNVHNNKLSSLEYAPKVVGDSFACHGNSHMLFHNAHKYIKDLHIGGTLFIGSEIVSHILGIMRIGSMGELKVFDFGINKNLDHAVKIINTHLGSGRRNIHDCQEELIEAGLGEYAKL
ncbi:MAG: hypothetical protein ACREAU_04130 [Nitrosopumilaceae archaeon]